MSKSESKEKSLALKARASALKKDMDTKMNIAKKVFSAKTQKKRFQKAPTVSKTNFDPSSINLKMKRSPTPKAKAKQQPGSMERNIVNSDPDFRYKIYPKILKKAVDPSILERQQEERLTSKKDHHLEQFLLKV